MGWSAPETAVIPNSSDQGHLEEQQKERRILSASKQYLLEGEKGTKYSGTSVGIIVHRAAKKCGIRIKVTPHALICHAFVGEWN